MSKPRGDISEPVCSVTPTQSGWCVVIPISILLAIFLLPELALGQTDSWLGGAGNWSNSAKWSVGLPTPTSNVFIDNGNALASSVTLDIQTQANNLTIDSDDSLSFNNGTNLTINGSSIGNAGTISINSAGGLTYLFVANGATLSGAGKVILSNNSQSAIDGNGGATLTNQSTIQGVGTVGPHFVLTNQGTVNADVSGGILAVVQGTGANNTNTATLEATSGGILQISTGSGGALNNSGGTIQAVGTGSQVQLTGFGTIINGGSLTTSTGGTIVQPSSSSSTLNGVTNSGTFSILNGANVNLSNTLTNNGTIGVNSTGGLTLLFLPTGNVTLSGKGRVVLNNNPNSVIDGNGGLTFTNKSTIQGGGTIGPHFTFLNNGTLRVTQANTLNINGPFVNFSGTTLTGGTYLVTGTLQFTNANIITNAAKITLTGSNARITNQSAVNALAGIASNAKSALFSLASGQALTTSGGLTTGNFANAGSVMIGAGSAFQIAPASPLVGSYTQSAGTTTVDGLLKAAAVKINLGTLFGKGMIVGSLTSSGSITPGDSATKPGKLSPSAYTQNSTASLNVAIGGTNVGTQYGQLAVANGASLNGKLNIKLINGFVPANGNIFTILTGTAISGKFSAVNGMIFNNNSQCFQVTYGASSVTLTAESGTGCTNG